jgi:hypothetical protein
MKAALEALDTISQVNVARFVNGYGFDWRVTFVGELGNIQSLLVNDASLSGPFAYASVSTATQGMLPANYSSFIVHGGYARSAIISNLQQGVEYQVRVRSHNFLGYSYVSSSRPAFLSPKAAPSVPYNISIFALSNIQLRVNWFAPINSGGANIVQYQVQWDVSSTFANVESNGNSRVLSVSSSDGPVFCFTIDIVASSSGIARFARVAAYNSFMWSPFGYPTPVSSTGQIKAPGAPSAVVAASTDANGIIVSWSPPDAMTCFFGGNGGSQVTYYVVEWDFRQDFSTPASQAFIYDVLSLSYLIGGRNVLTGKVMDILNPLASYYVRVTAFNSIGASVAGYASGPIVLSDEPPLAPRDIHMFPMSATQLYSNWNYPLRDGGSTLEKYRFEV